MDSTDVRIGDISQQIRGVSYDTSEASKQPATGLIPILRANNIDNGEVNLEDLVYVPSYRVRPQQYLIAGDVLIAGSSGSLAVVGKAATIREDLGVGFGAFCKVLRPSKEVEVWPPYFAHFFQTQEYRRIISGLAVGANINNLKNEHLDNLEIPLPPLPEQRRIVAVLDEKLAAVARARAAARAQLEAARALPAAYLRAVFEGEEARGWPRYFLGDITRIDAPIVDPTLPEFRSLLHVSGENIESGTGRLLYLNTAEEDGMISGKYLFDDSGVVLYSKLRPYLRKVSLARFRGLCSADMYPIAVDPSVLSAEFLVWLLLSEEFTNYANEESQRSRMPKLNRQQLFSFNAAVPSLSEQQSIASFLTDKMTTTEGVSVRIIQEMDSIDLLPSAYLQQAFRGELN